MNVNGLVMSQKTKTGVLTTYEYDALGRRTVNLEPRTGSTITHYNSQNQVDYVADPAGNRTTYSYDSQTGRKISETNSLNKTTYYTYNNLGQVLRVWGAAEPVEYVYDNYGRLSELHTFRQGNNWQSPIWPEGQTGTSDITKWHYQESTGLLTSKEYPDAKSVAYTYATGGKLQTRTWARTYNSNPLVTTYTYNVQTGELLNIDYGDTTPDVTFTYDRLGRQMTVTDYVGSRTFSYNPNALRLDAETITGLINKTITRTYEESGGGPEGSAGFNQAMTRDSETEGVPGRNTGFILGTDYSVTYGYEPNTGRFASVAWNAAGKTGSTVYSYLPNSDLLQNLATDDGQLVTYQYDPYRNFKTQVKNQSGTTVISQYDYQYDPLGRRTKMDTIGTAPWGTLNLQPETSNYATNNLNQYSSISSYSPQPSAFSLFYDEDGNLISITEASGVTQYVFNAENQLVSVIPLSLSIGSKKVEFAYDYMGRRVHKKVFEFVTGDWQLQTDSLFLYDGWNMIRESSVTGQQAPIIKSYVWGLDLIQSLQGAGGIGGLIAAVDNGEAYHCFYDGNGNVGQLIKSSDGSIAAHYEYDPYGNTIVKSGLLADENPIRFSTKFFDNETGLGYWGYRYYSPSLGRWISRDPLEEEGGQNLYVALENNPINEIDSLGLTPKGGVYGSACEALEAKIRSFIHYPQDYRAWDRFVSGSGLDIFLTNQEMESALGLSSKFQARLSQLKSKCDMKQNSSWYNQVDIFSDTLGPPWAVAIGGVTIKITTTCNCGCLFYNAEINDYFDFDPIWKNTHRTPDAERKVRYVWLAQLIGQCGWKEFYHKGQLGGKDGSNCKKSGV